MISTPHRCFEKNSHSVCSRLEGLWTALARPKDSHLESILNKALGKRMSEFDFGSGSINQAVHRLAGPNPFFGTDIVDKLSEVREDQIGNLKIRDFDGDLSSEFLELSRELNEFLTPDAFCASGVSISLQSSTVQLFKKGNRLPIRSKRHCCSSHSFRNGICS